nr:MAG TPA: putative tail fiber protein [Caudoviricetes sp.]
MALPRMLQLAHSTDNTTIVENNQIATAKDIAINGNLEDLASARGQVGNAKKIPDLDFNTLVTPGNYRITGYPTNGPSLPLNISGASIGSLIVTGTLEQNGRIFQIMISAGAITWRTTLDMTGATWSNWQQLLSGNKVGDGIRVTNGVISIPEMEGATSTQNGTSGLVPPPLKTDVGKTLSAEGNWIYPADIAISNNQSDLATQRGQIGIAKELGNNVDYNTVTKAGFYLINATGGVNGPIAGSAIFLHVFCSKEALTKNLYQIAYAYSSARERMFLRQYRLASNDWSSWSEIVSSSRIGDGITVNNGIISVPEYEGATTSTAGTSGLVPPAPAGKQNDFLTGGGEYKSALLTSGGKLTGSVAIVDTNNAVGTTPSADTEYGLYFEDKNAFVMGGVDFLQRQTSNNDKLVQIFSKNSSGKYQTVSIITSEDGTGKAAISCPTSIQGAVTNLSGTYTSLATERYRNSAIEIRENNYVQNTQTDIGYAPSIGFHWSNTTNGTLVLKSDGAFAFINGSGARATVNANVPYASESGTATKWNGAAKTVSTAAPSGGANGDIWFQY